MSNIRSLETLSNKLDKVMIERIPIQEKSLKIIDKLHIKKYKSIIGNKTKHKNKFK
jgi:hypothetical protein